MPPPATHPILPRQWALLGSLLILPSLLLTLGMPRPWLAVFYALVMSAATYGLYVFDKQRAQSGGWRIPESRLHLFALLGGWPGAYLAQRRYRHKTAKPLFKAVFWSIVIMHQLAGLDGLLGWPVLSSIGR